MASTPSSPLSAKKIDLSTWELSSPQDVGVHTPPIEALILSSSADADEVDAAAPQQQKSKKKQKNDNAKAPLSRQFKVAVYLLQSQDNGKTVPAFVSLNETVEQIQKILDAGEQAKADIIQLPQSSETELTEPYQEILRNTLFSKQGADKTIYAVGSSGMIENLLASPPIKDLFRELTRAGTLPESPQIVSCTPYNRFHADQLMIVDLDGNRRPSPSPKGMSFIFELKPV